MILNFFVSSIKNNINLKKSFADVPFSLLIQKCLIIFLNEGYILGFKKINNKTFRVFLKYYKGKSVIKLIESVSVSGFRKYITLKNIISNYNASNLLILSTSEGILSNFELILKYKNNNRKFLFNLKNCVQNPNTFTKFINFYAIDKPLDLVYSFIKFTNFKLNNILFHKQMILTSFFRPKSIISKLSKRQIFRSKILKIYLKKYLYSSLSRKISHDDLNILYLNKLNTLYFFKFNKFFQSFNYLNFKKSENFYNYILSYIYKPIFSIFYFIIYLKQFQFSKYKYRFSIYLKYLNHLIKYNNNLLIGLNQNKWSCNGGEILLRIQ